MSAKQDEFESIMLEEKCENIVITATWWDSSHSLNEYGWIYIVLTGIKIGVDGGDSFCSPFSHQEHFKSKSKLKRNIYVIFS